MKFRLAPTGDDYFGSQKDEVIDLSEHTAAPDATFKLHEDSFLPANPVALDPGDILSALGASSESIKTSRHSFPEFRLAAVKKDDYFESPSTGGGGTPFRLAAVEKGDSLFAAFGSEPAPEEEPGSFRKGADAEFHKFCQFSKVEETEDGNVLVWGVATLEAPDLEGEICDYDTAKDAYKAWSLAAAQRTSAAGQQISLGPIRRQHTTEPAGKAVKIQYDDDNKRIMLGSVPISDDIREQLQQGFLTGYSQGGSYGWRKCADCGKSLTLQQANNFCPACKKTVPVLFGLKRLTEVSYVDSPCTGKGFDYVKSDGSHRFVAFAKRAEQTADGITVLSTEPIFRKKIWKTVALIGGRKRTIVHWENGHLVV